MEGAGRGEGEVSGSPHSFFCGFCLSSKNYHQVPDAKVTGRPWKVRRHGEVRGDGKRGFGTELWEDVLEATVLLYPWLDVAHIDEMVLNGLLKGGQD